jgi:DNA-binding transcriptional LysR family regulator
VHDVDTALLRTFVTLAETASFSRTAALIGRSQSAVSGQVQKLEGTFGRKLFERDTRNVRLTPDGERLLGHARAMVAAADAMLARFRDGDLTGEVRFGSPEDFASAYLPEILSVFAASHPHVEIKVACRLTLELVAEFERGEQDLIVVKQDPERRLPGARPLWRERLVWAGAAEGERSFAVLAAARRAARRPFPLVLAPAPCVYRARAAAALDAQGLPWAAVYTSPSFAGCVAAVRAGLGVSVMPRSMVPEGVAALDPGDGWPDLPDAEMALLGAARMSRAAAALAAFIEERVTRRRAD